MPYPDELMYSVLARYHYYTPKESFRRKQERLFGRVPRPSLKFASFLEPLCQRLDMAFTPDDFMEKHTLLPYYIHLVPREVVGHARSCLLGSSQNLMTTLSRTKLSLKDREFRYCPLCAKEDLEKYGETFFRVQSHLDGIDVCPKHLVRLKNYPYDKSVPLGCNYLMVEPGNLDLENISPIDGAEANLAKMAGRLASLPMNLCNGVEVREGVKKVLAKNGLHSRSNFNQEETYNLVKDRNWEVLKQSNLLIDSFSSYNWLGSYLGQSVLAHPLIPLLLIEPFYGSFDDFIADAVEGEVVPEALACHNPFCHNYNKDAAKLVSIDSDYKGGIYRCSCGQVYHVFYDRIEDYKVRDYGKLYVESLLGLKKQGSSYSKMAGITGLTVKGVRKQLSRFEQGYVSVDDVTETYLGEVRSYKDQHSEKGNLDLATKFKKQYVWIRQYRPECVSEFKTSRKCNNRRDSFKDYSQKDEEYLTQAKQVIKELFECVPPVQVSKRLITQTLKPSPSRFLLSRMERTRDYIDSHCESRNEFYLRNLKAEVRELFKQEPGFVMTPLNVSKKLGKSCKAIKKHWEEIVTIVT